MTDYVNGLKSLSGLRRLSPEMSDFLWDAAEEMERLKHDLDRHIQLATDILNDDAGRVGRTA